MMALPSSTRIWIACGVTDLRNGFDGLAALVQTQLSEDAFSGQAFHVVPGQCFS
jgi:transposase